jgi:signal transduction histidine kinase
LRQALLNLVDNAIKYTPRGGRIEIRVAHESDNAVIQVGDTGPGIPPEFRNRVFDRFYRVDGSRSRGSGGGMGLGLSIARWAVEVHGGELTLERADDNGSIFRITLPGASIDEVTRSLHAVS